MTTAREETDPNPDDGTAADDPSVAEALFSAPEAASRAEDLASARARASRVRGQALDAQERAAQAVRRAARTVNESRRLQGVAKETAGGRTGNNAAATDPAADEDLAARLRRLEDENAQLRQALANRPRIEHLVGMVMLTLGCSTDIAWRTVTTISQHTNRKVTDLADIVAAEVASGAAGSSEFLRGLLDTPSWPPPAAAQQHHRRRTDR